MGQAIEKARKKLQNIGYKSLPQSFSHDESGLFKSKTSPLALKGFSVLLNPNEVEGYLSHLQFRKQHIQSLIQILYVDVKKNQDNYCKLTVYIEAIAVHLQEIFSVHFNSMIKILYHSLKGFKVLHNKYGYFTIDSSMIGINFNEEPKCWANRKYSHAMPKPSYSYKKVTNGEVSMVEELKQMFNCQVNKVTIPHKFTLQGSTFDGLINELQTKFGIQVLNQKLQLESLKLSPENMQPTQPILQQQQPKAQSKNIIQKSTTGPQIRFNYQMKQPSRIRITYNNQRTEASRSVSTSVNKSRTKVNFSYQTNSSSIQQSPSINKSLQTTHVAESLIVKQ